MLFSSTSAPSLDINFLNNKKAKISHKKHKPIPKKIQSFKKIMKPEIDELKKWKDLTKFRNEIIAHNLRIKDAG